MKKMVVMGPLCMLFLTQSSEPMEKGSRRAMTQKLIAGRLAYERRSSSSNGNIEHLSSLIDQPQLKQTTKKTKKNHKKKSAHHATSWVLMGNSQPQKKQEGQHADQKKEEPKEVSKVIFNDWSSFKPGNTQFSADYLAQLTHPVPVVKDENSSRYFEQVRASGEQSVTDGQVEREHAPYSDLFVTNNNNLHIAKPEDDEYSQALVQVLGSLGDSQTLTQEAQQKSNFVALLLHGTKCIYNAQTEEDEDKAVTTLAKAFDRLCDKVQIDGGRDKRALSNLLTFVEKTGALDALELIALEEESPSSSYMVGNGRASLLMGRMLGEIGYQKYKNKVGWSFDNQEMIQRGLRAVENALAMEGLMDHEVEEAHRWQAVLNIYLATIMYKEKRYKAMINFLDIADRFWSFPESQRMRIFAYLDGPQLHKEGMKLLEKVIKAGGKEVESCSPSEWLRFGKIYGGYEQMQTNSNKDYIRALQCLLRATNPSNTVMDEKMNGLLSILVTKTPYDGCRKKESTAVQAEAWYLMGRTVSVAPQKRIKTNQDLAAQLQPAEYYHNKAIELGYLPSLYELGLIQYKQKKYDEAINFFDQMINAKGNDAYQHEVALAHWCIGLCQLKNAAYVNAIESFKMALSTSGMIYDFAPLFAVTDSDSIKRLEAYRSSYEEAIGALEAMPLQPQVHQSIAEMRERISGINYLLGRICCQCGDQGENKQRYKQGIAYLIKAADSNNIRAKLFLTKVSKDYVLEEAQFNYLWDLLRMYRTPTEETTQKIRNATYIQLLISAKEGYFRPLWALAEDFFEKNQLEQFFNIIDYNRTYLQTSAYDYLVMRRMDNEPDFSKLYAEIQRYAESKNSIYPGACILTAKAIMLRAELLQQNPAISRCQIVTTLQLLYQYAFDYLQKAYKTVSANLALKKDMGNTCFLLADAYGETGDLKSEVTWLDRGCDLGNVDSGKRLVNIGMMMADDADYAAKVSLGKSGEALLKKLAKSEHPDKDVLCALGMFYQHTRLSEARNYFKRAADLGSEKAREMLDTLNAKKGNKKAAKVNGTKSERNKKVSESAKQKDTAAAQVSCKDGAEKLCDQTSTTQEHRDETFSLAFAADTRKKIILLLESALAQAKLGFKEAAVSDYLLAHATGIDDNLLQNDPELREKEAAVTKALEMKIFIEHEDNIKQRLDSLAEQDAESAIRKTIQLAKQANENEIKNHPPTTGTKKEDKAMLMDTLRDMVCDSINHIDQFLDDVENFTHDASSETEKVKPGKVDEWEDSNDELAPDKNGMSQLRLMRVAYPQAILKELHTNDARSEGEK